MKTKQTEVLVIGGGATGAGVLRDLALRGYRCILVEKGDLTHGTTGRYHGLLHSGGRYVVKDPQAAKECIEENRILRRIMPQCIEDTGGFFVLTPGDDPGYAQRFLQGCRQAGIPCEEVPIVQMLREEPLLNPHSTLCFRVPDGSADSFLATELNAEAARQGGAQVLTYHKVDSLILSAGKVTGARCLDLANGEEIHIFADVVVNASGAWAGKVAASANIKVPIVGGKGTMVAMNHRIVNTVINRCKMPSDGDILVPAHTVSVIGTTDVKIEDADHFGIEPWEVHLCLEEGDKLVPGFKDMRMLRAWAGVRPLYQESAVSDTRDVTRAFVLLDHQARDGVPGLITITSGKWTTYRKMAEATVDLVGQVLGTLRPCTTHKEALPGAAHGHHYLSARLASIENNASYGELVCECELVTRSEVEQSITTGQAKTIDDVRRDVRLGMGPCQGGFCTYRAAGILHEVAARKMEPGGEPVLIQHTNAALREFLQERWKGLQPILWGQQLRQERLDELIYLNVLNADHLPGPESTPLAPQMYTAPQGEFKRMAGEEETAQDRLVNGSRDSVTPPAIDVLVVGAGYAGLMTAWRCAVLGKKVRLIAKGWGATHWAPGCVDVLGYDHENHLVEAPTKALKDLSLRSPSHPYARIGAEGVQAALQALKDLCKRSGYPLYGDLDQNWLLPTALGARRPTCLAPETMIAGDLRHDQPMLIVGFERFGDFYAGLIAQNLSHYGIPATSVTLELPELLQQRFINSRVLALLFEKESFRQSLVEELRGKLGNAERVGFPAVLGINSSALVHKDLENRLGRKIFEIPTLPPSIPGMRLHNILLNAIDQHGGRVHESMQVIGAQSAEGMAQLIWSEAAARNKAHAARLFVLATGGILGGGLVADYEGAVREVVFGLPVVAPENGRAGWFQRQFLAPGGHPVFNSGLDISDDFKPVDTEGNVILNNVFIAGSNLAHSDTIRERSLEGVALSSAYKIAEIIRGL